jgi:hypothetical protein
MQRKTIKSLSISLKMGEAFDCYLSEYRNVLSNKAHVLRTLLFGSLWILFTLIVLFAANLFSFVSAGFSVVPECYAARTT